MIILGNLLCSTLPQHDYSSCSGADEMSISDTMYTKHVGFPFIKED